MGPINWLAAIVASVLAIATSLVWYGPLFGRTSDAAGAKGKATGGLSGIGGVIMLQALSAVMMAHNFARLGADTLAAKPWLYWMQSGGIAIAFVIPALWISYAHHRISRRDALVDAGFWMVVYLSTGTVFWALR